MHISLLQYIIINAIYGLYFVYLIITCVFHLQSLEINFLE